jgi:hypothetical protein
MAITNVRSIQTVTPRKTGRAKPGIAARNLKTPGAAEKPVVRIISPKSVRVSGPGKIHLPITIVKQIQTIQVTLVCRSLITTKLEIELCGDDDVVMYGYDSVSHHPMTTEPSKDPTLFSTPIG